MVENIPTVTVESYEYLPVIEKALMRYKGDPYYQDYVDEGLSLASRIVQKAKEKPEALTAPVEAWLKKSLSYVPVNVRRRIAASDHRAVSYQANRCQEIDGVADAEREILKADLAEALEDLTLEQREFVETVMRCGSLNKACQILGTSHRRGVRLMEAASERLKHKLEAYA